MSRVMRGELSEEASEEPVRGSGDEETTEEWYKTGHRAYGRGMSDKAGLLVILSEPLPEHHANRVADAIRLLYGVAEVTYVPHDIQQAIANETALAQLRGQITGMLWPDRTA